MQPATTKAILVAGMLLGLGLLYGAVAQGGLILAVFCTDSGMSAAAQICMAAMLGIGLVPLLLLAIGSAFVIRGRYRRGLIVAASPGVVLVLGLFVFLLWSNP